MKHNRRPNTEPIAMLGSFPPLRALSSYCLELSSALSELCKVEFISFRKIYPTLLYPGGDLSEDHTFPSKKSPSLNVRRRLTWYNPVTWFIEGFFTEGRLLHAQWWSPPLAPVYLVVCLGFRLRRRPVVFTVHNVLSHEKSFFYGPLSKMLFSMGSLFIVHSEMNRKQLIKGFQVKPDRVIMIPHGPLDFHVRRHIDRESIRKKLGFSPGNKVILLFGAVRSYKGVDTALKAFAEVIHKIPDSRLLIAGKLWVDCLLYTSPSPRD